MGDSSYSHERRNFPATHHSAIVALKSENRQERHRAMSALAETYWRPVYSYLRFKWKKNREDARDLTQSFFTAAIDKDYLLAYDPSVARFRTFLRTCVDRFVQNSAKFDSRIKRGGASDLVSIDFAQLESGWDPGQLAGGETPEERFEKDWIRSLFVLALDRLQRQMEAEGKAAQFNAFKRYDIDRFELDEKVTYEELATELKIDTTTLTNYLSSTRRRFREIVLEVLAQITASESEYRDEARIVLGIDIDK
jgi:RNA polymerase sigma factor (sigma-70 family)